MEHVKLYDDPAAHKILEERARLLAAQEHVDDEALGEEIIVFSLGGGQYAMPARSITSVQLLEDYTPLPSTPPCIIGLVNLRGRLLTALDISPLLDLPKVIPGPGALLLIVAAGSVEVGLLADAVIEVRRAEGSLTPTLAATAGRGTPWMRGVDQQLVFMLDPQLLLADPRLIVNYSYGS